MNPRLLIFVQSFYTLTPVLLMYCSTYSCSLLHLSPSFFSLPLFCSSDCDELSHLKCFLSLWVPGRISIPLYFPRSPPPPSTESPHFLCTDISILYLIAVVSFIPPYLFYACLSLPLSISAPIPLLYSEFSNCNHSLRPPSTTTLQ